MSGREPAIARAVAGGEGESIWSLGTLVRVKVTGEQTGGRFSLWEHTLPGGAAPPLHTHPQDESYYLLKGQMTIWLGERKTALGPGSFAIAPAGVPHSFHVDSESAVVLILSTPAGIEGFLRDVGTPAERTTLPPADARRPTDEERAEAERANGIEIVGPPPGPEG